MLTLRINTSTITKGDFTLYGHCGPGLPLCCRASFPDFDYTPLEMGMVLQRSLLGGFGVHHVNVKIHYFFWWILILMIFHTPDIHKEKYIFCLGLHHPFLGNALWAPDSKEERPIQQLLLDWGHGSWDTSQSYSWTKHPIQNCSSGPWFRMLRYRSQVIHINIYITLILNDLGQTISKTGRKQFTGTAELKKTQSPPQLILLQFILRFRRLLLPFQSFFNLLP